MAFVYLSHKKNLKEDGKKLQDLGVAGFRVWFGHFLVTLLFFYYKIIMSVQTWIISAYTVRSANLHQWRVICIAIKHLTSQISKVSRTAHCRS